MTIAPSRSVAPSVRAAGRIGELATPDFARLRQAGIEARKTALSPDSRALRVVYVAGSGHSGSTLLALLLNAHPKIVSVGETAVKPKIRQRGEATGQRCSCGKTVGTCPFWGAIFRSVTAQGYGFGSERWSNDYQYENPLLRRLLTRDSSHGSLRALQRWAARHLPVHASRMRRTDGVNVAFIRATLEIARAEVFCDTSKHTFRLARLLDIGALDVKVISLVRDVRGYVASAKRRGAAVADATATWCKDLRVVEAVTTQLPADRKLLLRYEDLCADPEATLRTLYRYCGVRGFSPLASVNAEDHHVLGNRMRMEGHVLVRLDESWRTTLDAHEQRQVLDIAGAMNRELGYA